jgi:argininosuccinate synthase
MGRIWRTLPAQGTRIGIAFSGGLDTRTAVAWLARKGLEVYAYTADLLQPDVSTVEKIPAVAIAHGAAKARVIDCKDAIAREGFVALQSGAFHLETAGKKYFNTTPLGRAVTATAIVRAMQEDGARVFSDGSTHKGNDIQRFYRYGLLVNPELEIYKPWLDRAFVDELGGRREMTEWLARVGLPYTESADKAYSTDSNVLGATHEAKDLERLDRSLHDVEPIMGVMHWRPDARVEAERVTVEMSGGIPVSLDGERFGSAHEAFARANAIAGRHGLGTSDQIENRVIEAKSRGVYEAPGMALFHVAYERILAAVHDESTIDLYSTLGRRLGRLLYEGRWFDPEAMLIKEALVRWVAAAVTGTVTLELRRGDDYTILDTRAEAGNYDPAKLSMEKTAALFTPEDRIGSLEMQTLGILDSRALLRYLARAPKGAPPRGFDD